MTSDLLNLSKKLLSIDDFSLLKTIADMPVIPDGAVNVRKNGEGVLRQSTENVTIVPKEGKSGIDIYIKANSVGEKVHIPVIITEGGVSELVYNDFYVGENAVCEIVAGCGIHNNDSCTSSRHDGVHAFHLGKGAKVKYTEKHFGGGSGSRIMNPITEIYMEEDSVFDLDTTQIEGVTSTDRRTFAKVGKNAKLNMTERLVTHDDQIAKSDVDISLEGEGSSLQIISRSVARDSSKQIFHPRAIGNALCAAHIQCDSIIMDKAVVTSIPEIVANCAEAEMIHEAAIGRINSEQLLKLQTLGLTTEEAETVIIEGFLE
jgi:Fe-S cluster assembly scaffold protein SufB